MGTLFYDKAKVDELLEAAAGQSGGTSPNATTLEGHPASYFATASDLSGKFDKSGGTVEADSAVVSVIGESSATVRVGVASTQDPDTMSSGIELDGANRLIRLVSGSGSTSTFSFPASGGTLVTVDGEGSLPSSTVEAIASKVGEGYLRGSWSFSPLADGSRLRNVELLSDAATYVTVAGDVSSYADGEWSEWEPFTDRLTKDGTAGTATGSKCIARWGAASAGSLDGSSLQDVMSGVAEKISTEGSELHDVVRAVIDDTVKISANASSALPTSNTAITAGTTTVVVPGSDALVGCRAAATDEASVYQFVSTSGGSSGTLSETVYATEMQMSYDDATTVAAAIAAAGKISSISVNGTAQTVTNKAVDITVNAGTVPMSAADSTTVASKINAILEELEDFKDFMETL